MKITVVILTCDRLGLTRQTVDSFLEHNNRSNFDIFYGDDASNESTHKFMASRKIPCIVRHTKRKGCSPTSNELIKESIRIVYNPLTLYLQNDFETVRPLPLRAICHVFNRKPDIGWMRLWGRWNNEPLEHKEFTHRYKKKHPVVKWTFLTSHREKIAIGDIDWKYHPCIHRTDILVSVLDGVLRDRHAGHKALETKLLTAVLTNNVVRNLGVKRSTPQGLFGLPKHAKRKKVAYEGP